MQNSVDYGVCALVEYGVQKGLLVAQDRTFVTNSLLAVLGMDGFAAQSVDVVPPLENILKILVDFAVAQGLLGDTITERDLFDAKLMGVLMPRPSTVCDKFWALYAENPQKATDWYYNLSQNSDYIRKYRIAKDRRWVTATQYGDLDITINLSKPEKDAKSIAAAKLLKSSSYPKCLLCRENEGYAGRINHPARQNHRVIPVTIAKKNWFMQFSPYVYYNEHCIVFSEAHTPMAITNDTFQKLLDFVEQFPHYFVGSNADLPIVGGSILSHDHFQGGNYTFAMERAPIEQKVTFAGYESVEAGIVKWPLSVIRLTCADKQTLIEISGKILSSWRNYTDAEAVIYAYSEDVSHNTITPIARMVDGKFQMDLVLRNNLTTEEHPDGLYHPHKEMHHIKKENIGLIEVMGLAVLPARLKTEMATLADILVAGGDPNAVEEIQKHADWAQKLREIYTFNAQNVHQILEEEIGKAFAIVLEHAGVYPVTEQGRKHFMKFIEQV